MSLIMLNCSRCGASWRRKPSSRVEKSDICAKAMKQVLSCCAAVHLKTSSASEKFNCGSSKACSSTRLNGAQAATQRAIGRELYLELLSGDYANSRTRPALRRANADDGAYLVIGSPGAIRAAAVSAGRPLPCVAGGKCGVVARWPLCSDRDCAAWPHAGSHCGDERNSFAGCPRPHVTHAQF